MDSESQVSAEHRVEVFLESIDAADVSVDLDSWMTRFIAASIASGRVDAPAGDYFAKLREIAAGGMD